MSMAVSMNTTLLTNGPNRSYLQKSSPTQVLTLNTMCIIILRPAFPGYLPTMFVAVKSNKFAPASVQILFTKVFFPTPRGPAIRTDLIRGAFSCIAWEPCSCKKGWNSVVTKARYFVLSTEYVSVVEATLIQPEAVDKDKQQQQQKRQPK